MHASYPIRAIQEDEFPAYFQVNEEAFTPPRPVEIGRQQALFTFEFDRSLAAFDDGQIVGTVNAFTFQISLPGAQGTMGGLSGGSVLPTHRRRGIWSQLMCRMLGDIHDRGEAVAALFASEASIYTRYGFGAGTRSARFTVRRGDGGLAGTAGGGDGLRLRAVTPESARAELAKVYNAILPDRPGFIARDDRWWDAVLFDPECTRRGSCPLRCLLAEDESGPRGYALFTVQPDFGKDAIPAGALTVREIMSADPLATSAIWRDLLSRDLIEEVRARIRPVDDPLPHLLADPRRARCEISDGLWIRLVDVGAALAQRRYSADVDVVIEVTDEFCPWNSGRWRLTAAAGASPACARTTAPADLALPVAALSEAFLGGTRLGELAAAGLVTERRPGAIAAVSTAMAWDPAPWCPHLF